MREPVTVIMGAYNSAGYVAAALASVREQTFADFEAVVIDAGSTDTTAEVVACCAAEDPRIRLIRSPRRLTAPQARNAALAEVRTDLVATLDADDMMLPHRLEDQVEVMRLHPETVALGGGLRIVDSDGLPPPSPAQALGDRPLTPRTIEYAMPMTCPFLASAGMYQTEALREVGGFTESSPWADDYAAIWRLSRLGPLRQLPQAVAEYRRHQTSLSARRQHSQQLEVALLRRDIATVLMGRPPKLSSVLAWTMTAESPRSDIVSKAQDELVELHETYVGTHDLDNADLEWIMKLHGSRMARLSAALNEAV